MFSGVLVVDKPYNVSSGEHIRKLKKIIGKQKIGHAGTLDPLATGILIVCLGQMTRYTDYLASASKSYEAEILFGNQTTTGDIEGDIIQSSPFIPEKEKIFKVLDDFIGEIDQIPPRYSSIKYKGKSLYQYARKGIEIEIPSRKVIINSIEFISFEERTLKLNINCGKGTYIRVLAEDISKKLGTVGTLANLRRVESANFKIDKAIDLDLINSKNLNKKIIPPGDALNCLDEIQCAPEIINRITKGQKVEMKLTSKNKFLRLFDNKKNFLGIIENCEGFIKPKRLLTIDYN